LGLGFKLGGGGGRQVRSNADAGQAAASPAGRVRVGSGRLAGPSRRPRLPGGSRGHRGSESCQRPPQKQGAGTLVPVPDLPGDGDRTSAPDLPGDGGRSPVPVPYLSGIGDGVPPSPSPICYLLVLTGDGDAPGPPSPVPIGRSAPCRETSAPPAGRGAGPAQPKRPEEAGPAVRAAWHRAHWHTAA
jgi:hypothetical protein